jgi:hypothetical protein
MQTGGLSHIADWLQCTNPGACRIIPVAGWFSVLSVRELGWREKRSEKWGPAAREAPRESDDIVTSQSPGES